MQLLKWGLATNLYTQYTRSSYEKLFRDQSEKNYFCKVTKFCIYTEFLLARNQEEINCTHIVRRRNVDIVNDVGLHLYLRNRRRVTYVGLAVDCFSQQMVCYSKTVRP